MINLDSWLDLKNWTGKKTKKVGAAIIDEFLTKPTWNWKMAQIMATSPIHKQSPTERKLTRLRLLPSKLDGFEVAGVDKARSKDDELTDNATTTTNIKVNSYTLNEKKQLKRSMKKINKQSCIEAQDGGGQYKVILCPPTYL